MWGTACLDPADTCEEDFAFEIFAEVSPQADTLQVGDSLDFVFSIPVNATNVFDGEQVNLTDYPFHLGADYQKVVPDQAAPFSNLLPALGDFSVYQTFEGAVQLVEGSEFQSSLTGNEQLVEFSVVPGEAGLFVINFGSIGLFQADPVVLGDALCDDNVVWLIEGPNPDNYELIEDITFGPEAGDFKQTFQNAAVIAIRVLD
jgi:hypothetical protein